MTPEQLQAKLALLADTVARLRRIPTSSLDAFRADERNVDAALRRLQVAIQILIDVGGHVVARLGLGVPETSQDALDRLERAGHLAAGDAARFGRIFAFRNRIVHLYDRVDDAVVHEVLVRHIGDLEDLARAYLAALSK
jgi:uncharacterized protein YutE (UPF0331/DUF86 family)